jgi:hypothetical protein
MRVADLTLPLAAAAALGVSVAAQAQSPTPADPAVVAEMAAAAQALIAAANAPNPIAATMGFNPSERLHHPLDSDARGDWSYWPRQREGLTLGQMTSEQRRLAHELLETLLSARGYHEVQSIWSLEAVLDARETTSFARGVENYAFAVFGVPGAEGEASGEPWGWRVDGHHLSLNVTVVGDELSVTPSFFGANPARVDTGLQAGLEPVRYETRAAFALLTSLDEAQAARAVIDAEAPRDILSGHLNKPREAWDDWKAATAPAGLPAAEMTEAQRGLLATLIDEIAARYRDEIAEPEKAAIGIDGLSFAWMGSTVEGAPYYMRLAGPSFVYELDVSGPDGNHIHTVWRDPEDDFGEAALERHYTEHPH